MRRTLVTAGTVVLSVGVALIAITCEQRLQSRRNSYSNLFRFPFKPAHGELTRDAIPGLIAFYADMRRFPSSTEGWNALFERPTASADEKLWNGPYVREKSSDNLPITHTGFLGCPVQEYQAMPGGQAGLIWVHGFKESDYEWKDLYIVLSRIKNADRELAPEILAVLNRVRQHIVPSLQRYRDDLGDYPGSRELLEKAPEGRNDWRGPYLTEATLKLVVGEAVHCYCAPIGLSGKSKGFVVRIIGNRSQNQLPPDVMLNLDLFDKAGDVAFGFLENDSNDFDLFLARGYVGAKPDVK